MIYKIAYNNIKKSIKDYAVYFFTVMLGVAVFYVFNAIGSQSAMLKITKSSSNMIKMMTGILSGVSVLVSIVLGFLIVYANSFLIKRRRKEFGVYMILGMSKKKVSYILFIETLLVGLISLGAGLVIGGLLSQLMGLAVAKMFAANMTAYRFTFSFPAMLKTIEYFGIMYLFVMIFNTISISKAQIITLLRKKENQSMKMRNPLLCTMIFIAGVIILGYAYAMVIDYNRLVKLIDATGNTGSGLLIPIGMGMVSTFMIFYSVSSLATQFIKKTKSYWKGLNSFTFKQLSSQIHTMTVSLSIISILLFITITILGTASSMTASLNNSYKENTVADFSYTAWHAKSDFPTVLKKNGFDVNKEFKNYVNVRAYNLSEQEFGYKQLLGSHTKGYEKWTKMLMQWNAMSISDYNKLAKMYHHKQYTLGKNQYMMICDYEPSGRVLNAGLKYKPAITIKGHSLQAAYDHYQTGFIEMSAGHNFGVLIVPDHVLTGSDYKQVLAGNYAGKHKQATEDRLMAVFKKSKTTTKNFDYTYSTKIINIQNTVGIGALVTFVGMYIGIVFLITSAAILALKTLSQMIDSTSRYEVLRKMGTEESMMNHSILKQVLVLFIFPLILAIIHSVAGMKFSSVYLSSGGFKADIHTTWLVFAALAVIYGGYIFVTYQMSKNICHTSKTTIH